MSWYYDEMRQIGVDFDDAEQVAAYESKQGATRDRERELIKRLSLLRGQVVADLGCGTGSFALEASRAGARVRAIDVSQAMLDYLRARAAQDGLDDIDYEHAGFLTFNAAPNSIDVVVSRFALHHLPDFWKQVGLVRVHQSLRDGGLLYLSDVAFSFDPREYEAGVEHWVARMPHESGFSRQDFETHVREEHSTYAWILEGMLERAGFEILEQRYPADEYVEYLCAA